MNLKEMFICAKTRDQSACEDGLVMTDEFVAVIDGVTAKSDVLWDGMKPGCYAKTILENHLYETTIRGKSAEKFFSELDRVITRVVDNMDPDMPTNERPKASIIIYNDVAKEIWRYGDCQCQINGEVFDDEMEIDKVVTALRSYVIEEAMMRGATKEEILEHDIGRDAIAPFLKMQATFENKVCPWGYPVLNGTGINAEQIKTWKVKEGDEVVLASDGYPRLMGNLEQSEEMLSFILQTDPLCIHEHKATKCLYPENLSYDDRTYVRLTV